jgi:hypothetical protein
VVLPAARRRGWGWVALLRMACRSSSRPPARSCDPLPLSPARWLRLRRLPRASAARQRLRASCLPKVGPRGLAPGERASQYVCSNASWRRSPADVLWCALNYNGAAALAPRAGGFLQTCMAHARKERTRVCVRACASTARMRAYTSALSVLAYVDANSVARGHLISTRIWARALSGGGFWRAQQHAVHQEHQREI